MKILYLIPVLFIFGCDDEPSMTASQIARETVKCEAAGLRAVALSNWRTPDVVTEIQCRPWTNRRTR